jgi:glycosyltransferase involved in cell wall biosynthesis
VLVATGSDRRHLTRAGVPADRVFVTGCGPGILPCGSTAAAGFRRRYHVAGPVVLCLGGGDPCRRDAPLDRAMGMVWHRRPEVTFVCLTERGASGRRTTRTSRGGHLIEIAGPSPGERAAVFGASSIVCLPSPDPLHGTAILDGWTFERPVVATRSADVEELLGDGRGGICVEADPHDLATALVRLLVDRSLADRMGAGGALKLKERYTWSHVVAATERILVRITAAGDRVAPLPGVPALADPAGELA